MYIHMYLFSPKHPYPGWCTALSRFHVLYNMFLLVIHYKYSSVYMTLPKSLTVPSSSVFLYVFWPRCSSAQLWLFSEY